MKQAKGRLAQGASADFSGAEINAVASYDFLATIAVVTALVATIAVVGLCMLAPPVNAGQPEEAMSALIGVERFLLGESALAPEQRAKWDIAPGGGNGKLDWADVLYIQQRLLTGVALANPAQLPPLRGGSVVTLHEYTWHGEPGQSALASHTERLTYPGKPAVLARHYDRRGNLVKTVNAAGLVTRLENYNTQGQPRTITEADGAVTNLQYHPRGWLLRSTLEHPVNSAQDAITSFGYDVTGKLRRVDFPSGRFIEYQRDRRGELIAVRDAGGQQLNYTLDAAGNRILESLCKYSALVVDESVADSNCVEHFRFARLYDGNNRLRRHIDGRGERSEFAYDRNGRLLGITNASGHSDQAYYNSLGQVTSLVHVPAQSAPASVQAVTVPVAFHYRQDNALLSVEASGDSTHFTPDAYGGVVQSSSAAHGVSHFGFDSAGNQVTTRDAEGRQQVFHYDAHNRLVRVQIPGDPEAQIDYLFGVDGVDAHAAGRLVFQRDASGSSRYTYDFAGRLAQRIVQIGNQNYPIDYFYDADGQLTGINYPGIGQLRYTLNASGQVREMRLNDAMLASNITYLPFGPPSGFNLGNGIARESFYAMDYSLSSVEEVGASFSATQNFEYDAVGNLLTYHRTGAKAEHLQFAYDSLSRLTQASDAAGSWVFDYDSAGNRLSRKRFDNAGNTVELLTYGYETQTNQSQGFDDHSNRLSLVQSNTGDGASLRFEYDATGKLVSKSGGGSTDLTLAYNGFGRVKKAATANQQVAEFAYNAFGQRASKSSGGSVWHYIYDEAGRLLGRVDATGTQSIWYVYLHGERIARIIRAHGDTAVEFYHNDHLGRPWALSNVSGELVWQASYAPFGNRSVSVENTVPQLHGLPGQLYDEETGFWYNYHRDYDSDTGRYLQGDPLGVQGGLNTYMYAGANPLRFTDPYGLFFFGPVCGTGASARFVPDGRFTDACRKHDDCYGSCGRSKEQCDLSLCTDGACLYGFMLSTVFSGASGKAYDNAQKGCDDCE